MNTDREASESKQTVEALHEQREWLHVTLSSIGDAVITTDTKGGVTFLNPVAQTLTGWTQDEATGVPLESVFQIVNEATRRTVENAATRALREGVVVGLANHTLLIAKDGMERPIDDSAAPIRNANGEVAGVVLVFRDITERKRQEQWMQDAVNYSENIIATLREPFLVLDDQLRIKTANRCFYETFHVSPEETENGFIYDLGNRQWDIPKLRALLAEVLSDHHPVHDFEVEHTFPTIGRKIMLLNARRFVSVDSQPSLILLAIEDITERKQFERALQRSEAEFRNLLEKLPAAAYTCNAEGLITYFNQRAVELWGRTPKLNDEANKFCGSFKLFYADGTPMRHDECWVALAIKEDKPYDDYEIIIEQPDGSRFNAVVHANPLHDDSGTLTVAVNVLVDITERRRAEEELRRNEERFRVLFELGPVAVFACDHSGVIQDYNRRAAELWGREPKRGDSNERYCGSFKLYHPDGRLLPHAESPIVEVLRTGVAVQGVEVFIERPDGSRLPVIVNFASLKDDHGEIVGAITSFLDITERQQAEAALEDSETRYRRLFETAQDAILILDEPTGKIFDANPFIKEMLGFSQAELVGKELWQIGFFRDKSENQAAFRELQAQRYIRYEHLPLETKGGQQIEVEFVSNVYQVDHHEVIQCNIRDITERSRLERQTHEQAEALADLHHRKDEFLAMLSHELRNPLSAIFNALHILRLQEAENPIQQKAKIILERQVGQLAHLVDDLLEVSRVITGRIQLNQERLEMRGIVEHAVESVRALIDRRKHQLSVSLPAEPIWLQADPSRLEQVVVNLLNNAAKYTDEGGQIWLTVEQEVDSGQWTVDSKDKARAASSLTTNHRPLSTDWVVLRVRDTGVGIAPELLPRIFDLFTQADRTLGRSQGGLGIGLSLVQKLVELHYGTVAAHSAGLGQGSEFIVRLPALSPARESIVPVETAKQRAQTSRVLVVDDNMDAADMLSMTLQIFGHEVQATYSGQTALDAAVEYQPHIVLLDIGMPVMDGYQVARHLRQQPQTKNVWLIATTGYGQDSDRQRSQEAGFDHHLVKPIDPQKLQDLLATLAKQPRSAATP